MIQVKERLYPLNGSRKDKHETVHRLYNPHYS